MSFEVMKLFHLARVLLHLGSLPVRVLLLLTFHSRSVRRTIAPLLLIHSKARLLLSRRITLVVTLDERRIMIDDFAGARTKRPTIRLRGGSTIVRLTVVRLRRV